MKTIKLGSFLSLLLLPIVSLGMGRTAARLGSTVRSRVLPSATRIQANALAKPNIYRKIVGGLAIGSVTTLAANTESLCNDHQSGINAIVKGFVLEHFVERNALMKAAERHDIETIKSILTADDIDINAQDSYGKTALMIALESGNLESFMMLLEKTDLSIEDNQGNTTLMLAAIAKNKAYAEQTKAEFALSNYCYGITQTAPEMQFTPEVEMKIADLEADIQSKEKRFSTFKTIADVLKRRTYTAQHTITRTPTSLYGQDGQDGENGQDGFGGRGGNGGNAHGGQGGRGGFGGNGGQGGAGGRGGNGGNCSC